MKCETCKFYDLFEYAKEPDEPAVDGLPDTDEHGMIRWVQPGVAGDDWCGEWAGRPTSERVRGFTLIEPLVVIAIVGILAAVGVRWYSDSQKPTMELKKEDWDCVKSEQRTHLQSMLVGKAIILQPITSVVCVQYSRRAG